MRDIICPQCGESFLARDVVFDFSDYILNLISDGTDNMLTKELGFKYYTDEEYILENAKPNNEVELEINTLIGPGTNPSNYFQFFVTNKDIFEYIIKRSGIDNSFGNLIQEVVNLRSSGVSPTYDSKFIECMRKICIWCFPEVSITIEEALGGQFSAEVDKVPDIIDMLCYVFQNLEKQTEIGVRMYCNRMNDKRPDYYVPDSMFVLGSNGMMNTKRKCCKNCAKIYPEEFGYYKMVPVTMLGSHFAAKTSFLVALLWCVQNMPPFVDRFKIRRLKGGKNEEDIVDENFERFEKGFAPIKTDFENSPIISFLINDVIYTFTDWPGEEFTKDDSTFAHGARRIIAKSRHFICSLVPEQIVPGIRDFNEGREDVDIGETKLIEEFIRHINLTDHNRPGNEDKLRTVTFMANKFDVFKSTDSSDARELAGMIEGLRESDILDDKTQWEAVTKRTREFFKDKMSALSAGAIREYDKKGLSFIPVAPYGRDAKNPGDGEIDRIRRGYLVGMPLLHILRSDGIIE